MNTPSNALMQHEVNDIDGDVRQETRRAMSRLGGTGLYLCSKQGILGYCDSFCGEGGVVHSPCAILRLS